MAFNHRGRGKPHSATLTSSAKRQVDLHAPFGAVLAQEVRSHAEVQLDASLSWVSIDPVFSQSCCSNILHQLQVRATGEPS